MSVGVVVVSVCGRRERLVIGISVSVARSRRTLPPPYACIDCVCFVDLRHASGNVDGPFFFFYAGNELRTSSLPLISFHRRFSMRHTVSIGNTW